ncbi:MAG: hypothetical protein ACLR17_20140 [Enterobacteriaceae bacterium]
MSAAGDFPEAALDAPVRATIPRRAVAPVSATGDFPEAALGESCPGDQTAQSRSSGKRERDRGFPRRRRLTRLSGLPDRAEL